VFCSVREPVREPLCGFYAAAFTRLLALFDLPVRADVIECRGTGGQTCVLQISPTDGVPDFSRPEAA
jgi:predicted hydrocarbon binding protein